MEIVEVTAFVVAIGALVTAMAGLIREVRQWSATRKKRAQMMTNMSIPECPSCLGTSVVRNGKVRGHQRYKCGFCQKNFSQEFEHRWPNDSRLVNLLLLASGESRDEVAKGCKATPETVSRWLLDAKEQKDWFIEVLADAVYYAVADKSESLEDAFEGTIKLYCMVTEDTSELGVSNVAQKLWDLLELRGQSAKFDDSQ